SFKGIMAAKKKPVEELDLAGLGVDAGAIGQGGARQETVEVTAAEERQAGEIIEDEGDAYEKIVEFLGELKVI
ncbi:MAG: electron transfer flavoprotein subunit alpha, partial [Actinomycetota bacterium]|nr:electron transfer flavoprotein subunit alpha [Actinomycetota bacterium]